MLSAAGRRQHKVDSGAQARCWSRPTNLIMGRSIDAPIQARSGVSGADQDGFAVEGQSASGSGSRDLVVPLTMQLLRHALPVLERRPDHWARTIRPPPGLARQANAGPLRLVRTLKPQASPETPLSRAALVPARPQAHWRAPGSVAVSTWTALSETSRSPVARQRAVQRSTPSAAEPTLQLGRDRLSHGLVVPSAQ